MWANMVVSMGAALLDETVDEMWVCGVDAAMIDYMGWNRDGFGCLDTEWALFSVCKEVVEFMVFEWCKMRIWSEFCRSLSWCQMY